jgi:hypothetical protein
MAEPTRKSDPTPHAPESTESPMPWLEEMAPRKIVA